MSTQDTVHSKNIEDTIECVAKEKEQNTNATINQSKDWEYNVICPNDVSDKSLVEMQYCDYQSSLPCYRLIEQNEFEKDLHREPFDGLICTSIHLDKYGRKI